MATLLKEAMKEELSKLVDKNAREFVDSFNAAYEIHGEAEFNYTIPIKLKLEAESQHKIGVSADTTYGYTVKKKSSTPGQTVSDKDDRDLFNQSKCLNCGDPVSKKGDELCSVCSALDPGAKAERRKEKGKGSSTKK